MKKILDKEKAEDVYEKLGRQRVDSIVFRCMDVFIDETRRIESDEINTGALAHAVATTAVALLSAKILASVLRGRSEPFIEETLNQHGLNSKRLAKIYLGPRRDDSGG